MNQEDVATAKLVRRLLDKRELETILTVVSCNRGHVNIGGVIKPLRSNPNASVRDEIEVFKLQVSRQVREVKQLTIDARIIVEPKKELPHHEEETVPTAVPEAALAAGTRAEPKEAEAERIALQTS